MQRFLPTKESTTSDSQVGIGSDTAEMYNLAAIMKNSVVVFEVPVALARRPVEIPAEKDTDQDDG